MAVSQKIGNIGRNNFMWRSFVPNSAVATADKVLIPDGFGSVTGAGNLDIDKLKSFFAGTLLSADKMKQIRLRVTVMGEPIAEKDVKDAFDTYSSQIEAKGVVYHYNADDSPFDTNYKGNSNCQGRAKGFLQLMAVLGVPKEQLNYCQIGGGAGEEDMKICQKGDADVIGTDVYHCPSTMDVPFAPNAIKVVLRNDKPMVERTLREPFANHYATFLEVPGLGFKYWDPLEKVAYRNGFADYFVGYDLSETVLAQGLTRWQGLGLKCLVNDDNKKERIYLLPPSSRVRSTMLKKLTDIPMPKKGQLGTTPTPKMPPSSKTPSLLGTEAYFNQAAFKEVEQKIAQMQAAEPQVAMIVDVADWGDSTGSHPPAIGAMFPA